MTKCSQNLVKGQQYKIGNAMYKGRDELYGTLGEEDRYSLVQGKNIFIPSFKVEETNIKGVS
jgi:hypothetical protein